MVRALEQRWDRRLTTLVAGAGFGKTTALAQAFRASALAPRGIEAWVSCDPEHEDAGRPIRALLDSLPGGADATDVVSAVIALAPAEVCVTVDDACSASTPTISRSPTWRSPLGGVGWHPTRALAERPGTTAGPRWPGWRCHGSSPLVTGLPL
ncbi:hypothetical protein [Cryptosporangium japonicum]|uniref:Uncharacterized protein n=1 Tax=Cryptosporangium japonicum TaxID=80872 RepID=A0ABN0UIL4_9ACTN